MEREGGREGVNGEEEKLGQERERERGREEGRYKEGRKKGVDMCMHVYACVCW